MSTTNLALGLPENAQFTLRHHDRPMRWRGNQTTWQGKPGEGSQTDQGSYTCDVCAATLELTLTEPDT